MPDAIRDGKWGAFSSPHGQVGMVNRVAKERRGARGFVLFVVLATLTLLTAVMVAARLNTASIAGEVRQLNQRRELASLAPTVFETAAAHIIGRTNPSAQLSGGFVAREAGGTIAGSFMSNAGLVDINQAPTALLQALLATAGVDAGEAATLAGRIIDWRDDDTSRITDGASESLDYAGNRNGGPKNAPFQTVLELAQVPGFDPDFVKRLLPFATVSSGLATVHPDLVDPELLLNVPGIDGATVNRLLAFIAGGAKNGARLADIAASDPVLAIIARAEASGGWHVAAVVTDERGHEERFEGDIAILPNDTRPFRVLNYAGPLEAIN